MQIESMNPTSQLTHTAHGWEQLPGTLRARLHEIARAYHAEGVELFLFGSFARGDNRRTSDLDLAVGWRRSPSREIFMRLWQEIEDLPTIRKIDLVDLSEAPEELREKALADRKPLI